MKQLLSLVFCLFVLLFGQVCFAQATAGQHNPYQNLAIWFATQSMPDAEEKALWALDDINSYRELQGLSPLPQTILKEELKPNENVRIPLAIAGIVIGVVGLVLLIYSLLLYWKEEVTERRNNKKRVDYNNGKNITVGQIIDQKLEYDKKREQVMVDVFCYGKSIDDKNFPIFWLDMNEERRRINAGMFVAIYHREPTEQEIITGEINNEN